MLDDGRIGERGTHDELLVLGGAYATAVGAACLRRARRRRRGRVAGGRCGRADVLAPGLHRRRAPRPRRGARRLRRVGRRAPLPLRGQAAAPRPRRGPRHVRVAAPRGAAARRVSPTRTSCAPTRLLPGPPPALVLETLGGETLAHLLATGDRRLSGPQVALLGAQLASALRYLHAQDHLHLDLKPSNVVVELGLARLLDLSVARRPGRAPRGMGTPDYMAPEQARGEPLSAATDVWGLGTVLFEAAAARPAFDGGGRGHVDLAQLAGRAPRIRTVRRVPAPLARVIDGALEPRPRTARGSTTCSRTSSRSETDPGRSRAGLSGLAADDVVALRPQRGLRAVGDPEHAEHAREVRLDGLLGDLQPAGDQLVGQPVADEGEDVELALGELLLGRAARGGRRAAPRAASGASGDCAAGRRSGCRAAARRDRRP